ncbi:DUF427 domain-containing protein [Pseudomonas sp. 10B1]|uniref:DUF427 domain-containing protein n=1 Tax=unclassified Pseudomonas TaxID=196821 RepID=UPI002AB50EF2|nr:MULTISPECIES: DUF427 domain-containing protein [unclassified Pseudomonas]MDY7559466.1 DUF427 domain-containing protein [Pseudomonas sp. AB6]MEA9977266.1 DUF427 domain-containing protein [Pseudomonas sp. RTS4]MEA9995663.1 DUF427 domain-containing protein [Pseudomonas sp. AA4]MEB0088010.1 DUF427 domain-containing protein [Pseudomonas sp. RTI1]MEB0127004.1 DUF427 domain-containing protein [Pseudomonas sp. CCC1.2]
MKTPGPDHPITLSPVKGRVTVKFQDVVVAQTENAVKLQEANYPAVFYIPRSDIRAERYTRTEHQTHCPYKGEAHYYSLNADGKTALNAVWTYDEPFPSVAEIKEHVAFYTDKVTFEVDAA